MNQHFQSIILAVTTILCWGSLAALGNLLIHLPPFFILGVSFILGSIPAWSKPREMFPSLKMLLFGVMGFFGYHFFLFTSFRYAPAIEANLINYMWPVVMVLASPVFFKEQKLKMYHVAGAALAVMGSVILVFGKGGELKTDYIVGYLLAIGAALIWPVYSIGKKKMPATSVWAIGGFCFGTGVLCLLTHFWFEPRVVLQGADIWKLLIMGLGPCGLAFYCWDGALRKGDPRVIGALSYLTPVISTLGLVVFAGQELVGTTTIAMLLIIAGASAGILDFLPRKK